MTNDTDVDGNPLTISSVTNGGKGTASIDGNGTAGTVTYTPTADLNGSDSFTYTISDGNGGTSTATVTVTIAAVNDAPVAANDSYSVNQGTTLSVTAPGVLTNDTDTENNALTAHISQRRNERHANAQR